MKKVIISAFASAAILGSVAFSALSVSAATSYVFSNYLTVGSRGADVVALQSFLVANNFLTMPAGVSMGYFGSLTKAGVVAYQASQGIVPTSGFVGPLTIAKLNNSAPVVTTTTGFTCPTGWTCQGPTTTTTTTTTAPTQITTPGVAGTLNIAKGTFVGNGITVQDGQAVDVASFDLQAGASDMQVSSVDFDFNVRPYLYVGSYSVVNANTGATLATVSGLSAANFTELIVGSEYRLTIPVSFVVKAGTKNTIVLHAQFATSNRGTTNIYVTRAEVRAVDGTGVTTTQAIGDGITTAGGLNLYVAYGGQNNSNIIATIDQASPNQGIIQTNTGTTQTQNVLLGIFDLKSQNINSTLQGLTVNINMSGIGSVGSVFANIQLKNGSTLLTSGSIASPTASTSAVAFTNFNLNLPMNSPTAVSVYATVNGGVNNVQASTSLTASAANIIGIDANSNPLTVGSSGTLPGANQLFSLSGVGLSNLAWTLAPTAAGGSYNHYPSQTTFSGSLTITAGSNSIYISRTGATALTLATSSSAGAGSAITAPVTVFAPSNGVQVYDPSGAYQIIGGSARTFNITGSLSLNNTGSTTAVLASVGATSVNLATGSDLSGAMPVTFLLQGLNSDFHLPQVYLSGTL